jgi:hypothetical protein
VFNLLRLEIVTGCVNGRRYIEKLSKAYENLELDELLAQLAPKKAKREQVRTLIEETKGRLAMCCTGNCSDWRELFIRNRDAIRGRPVTAPASFQGNRFYTV